MQKVAARQTRTAVTVKIATMNHLNLHQRKDTKQIYQYLFDEDSEDDNDKDFVVNDDDEDDENEGD
jgi:hypothetical protein